MQSALADSKARAAATPEPPERLLAERRPDARRWDSRWWDNGLEGVGALLGPLQQSGSARLSLIHESRGHLPGARPKCQSHRQQLRGRRDSGSAAATAAGAGAGRAAAPQEQAATAAPQQ